MNKLEKTQVERQLLLRNPPVRAQPRTQERPQAFDRIDMDFVKAIAIFISGIFPLTVIDCLVAIAPLDEPPIDRLFIRVDHRLGHYRLCDDRCNGLLLDILQHLQYNRATAFNHTENRRLLLG